MRKWVMSPSQAGEQDQGEAGTVLTRKHPWVSTSRPKKASVVTTIWDAQHKKKWKEPKRRVGSSAFPLFGNERSQNLAGEIHNR